MKRKILSIIPISLLFISIMGKDCFPAIEMIKIDFSSSHHIEVTASSYTITTITGGSNASLTELKVSTSSLVSGYLSQIPSIVLNPQIGSISGGGLSLENRTLGISSLAQPNIPFGNDLSPDTVSSATVKVVEIFDHLGNSKYNEWNITAEYDFNTKEIKLTPVSDWPKGSLFMVNLSSSIKDFNLLPLEGEPTAYFTTLMDATIENTVPLIENTNTKIHIAANACDEDFFVNLSTGHKNGIEDANKKLTRVLGNNKTPLKILNIDLYNSSATHTISNLNTLAKISFSYEDLDKDANGFIDGSFEKLKTQNLSIWRLNEDKNLWVRQSGYYVDEAKKEVSLKTDHFSTYALVPKSDEDVSNIHAYPVPFRPNAGNTQKYGAWSDGITFTNLPSEGKIRIYTISMRLVRTLEIIPNEIVWDVKNNKGEIVASGMYIWEAVSGNNRKTGKLVIIK